MKTSIILRVTVSCKPKQGQPVYESLLQCQQHSLQEAGCQEYALFRDFYQPDQLYLFEEWDDADALALHEQTEHYLQMKRETGHLIENVEIIKHQKVLAEV
ncbi:MAG: putative quinol monooxygenase [Enterovibrio sp.]